MSTALHRTIIQRDPTPSPLDDITTLLQAWLMSANTTVRSAAITLLLHTLHTYHTHLQFPPQVSAAAVHSTVIHTAALHLIVIHTAAVYFYSFENDVTMCSYNKL